MIVDVLFQFLECSFGIVILKNKVLMKTVNDQRLLKQDYLFFDCFLGKIITTTFLLFSSVAINSFLVAFGSKPL
jgi:hypothetical protein